MLNPGDKIGRYEIHSRIGQGAFGEVYLANDLELRRKVAIKIPGEGADEDASWRRILTEARTLAGLEHPSIVAVFDISGPDDPMYVVMEYLGRTVRDEMKQGPIAFQRTVELMINLAEALDYVHRRGLLHRNVKPGVILLDSLGQPRLGGFELAVESDRARQVEEGLVAGTPSYMSPERWRGKPDKLGPPMDVWGFGASFFEMLSGRLPFTGEDVRKTMSNILSETPATLRSIAPSIPEDLERICLRCLEKDLADRYSSMDRVAEDLRGWLRGQDHHARSRVFISHSSKDREFVEREVVALLEGRQIKTWYSKVDIQTAAQWERSIMEGLESCEWFLLVMSPSSAASEWVKDELHWAIENRPGRIIPLLMESCDLRAFHIRMARLQYVDFRADLEGARKNLVTMVEPV